MHPSTLGSNETWFSSLFGSSLLNSQVLVPRRRFVQCVRHAIKPHTPGFPARVRRAPFSLVVSPNGQHGVLLSSDAAQVLDDQGNERWVSSRWDVIAFDDVVFVAGNPATWDGTVLPEENSVPQSALARRLTPTHFAAVWAGSRLSGQNRVPAALNLRGGLRVRQPREDWIKRVEGSGVAAIAQDLTAFLAFSNHKLKVFAPRADSQDWAILVTEQDVGMAASQISLIGSKVFLLAASGNGTLLRVFTRAIKPVYSLTVPLQAYQPAVAGAAGRAYLVGNGLVAIDHGKVTWKHESTEPLYVSSFEDGSLAVANGKRLDFLKPDGTVDQSFPAEEPLVAPPAIAADGSVWAASATALYIAR